MCGGGVKRKGKRERDEWALWRVWEAEGKSKTGKVPSVENLPGVWIGEVGKAQPKAAAPSAMIVSVPAALAALRCKTCVP